MADLCPCEGILTGTEPKLTKKGNGSATLRISPNTIYYVGLVMVPTVQCKERKLLYVQNIYLFFDL